MKESQTGVRVEEKISVQYNSKWHAHVIELVTSFFFSHLMSINLI
jgi:hypothetical protein